MAPQRWFAKNSSTEPIEVSLERWVWGAVFDDDTELRQFDADGNWHSTLEIDQSRLKMFVMHRADDLERRIDIPFVPGMQLIHFYRNVRPHYDTAFHRVYVCGWKRGNDASYIFILPDDRIIASPVDNIDLVSFDI